MFDQYRQLNAIQSAEDTGPWFIINNRVIEDSRLVIGGVAERCVHYMYVTGRLRISDAVSPLTCGGSHCSVRDGMARLNLMISTAVKRECSVHTFHVGINS